MKKGKGKIERYGRESGCLSVKENSAYNNILADLKLKDAEEFRKYLRMNTESFEIPTIVIMLFIIALYMFFINSSKIRSNIGDA